MAAYYGLVLSAAGQTYKAAGKYLNLASQARLLPEEKALVQQARRES